MTVFNAGIETEKSLPAVASVNQTLDTAPRGKASRLDELLVAEIFLVQATIESASALGDGLQAVREIRGEDRGRQLVDVFRSTRDQVVEPYRERYSFFRRLRGER